MIRIGQARNHGFIDGEVPEAAQTKRGVGTQFYSEAERMLAERTKGATDPGEIAFDPKHQAENCHVESANRHRAMLIERQAIKEREAAERLAAEQAEAQRLSAGKS